MSAKSKFLQKYLPILGLACLSGGAFILSACSSESKPHVQNDAGSDDPDKRALANDLKDEIEIGRAMAAKLAGTLGVDSSHTETTKYLNLITRTLARYSSRSEIDYYVAISQSDDVNAFACPGGYIFVTKALLKSVKSEDELAGILGHEISHITEKHMYNQIKPKRNVTTGESLTRMMSHGGSDIGGSLSKMVNQGLDILLDKGWGQEKEGAADDAGVMLALSAGYNPKALYDFLDRIGHNQGVEVKVGKTHPPFNERLKNLSAFMKKNGIQPAKKSGNEKLLDARFQEYVGSQKW